MKITIEINLGNDDDDKIKTILNAHKYRSALCEIYSELSNILDGTHDALVHVSEKTQINHETIEYLARSLEMIMENNNLSENDL